MSLREETPSRDERVERVERGWLLVAESNFSCVLLASTREGASRASRTGVAATWGGVEQFRLLLASTREEASRASRTGVAATWRGGIIPPPTRFYLRGGEYM